MQTQVIRKPVEMLVIDGLFPKQVNKRILEEAVKNKKNFKLATINRGTEPSFRNNLTCMYDDVYTSDRSKSYLLSVLDGLFSNQSFIDCLSSFTYPMTEFGLTNTHETQVSRYGKDHHYDWHIDKNKGNNSRLITIVYYFFKEPKKFKGGDLIITSSPIVAGNPIEKDIDMQTIEPKNNRAVIFSCTRGHRVENTISPAKFEDGRFSANIWMGTK